jgi:YjbE family integral membrane protein
MTEWIAELLQMDPAILSQIILADIVLSGDNALVIGMAASSLRPALRKKAIMFGIAMAIVFRVIFAVGTTFLLGIPGLKMLGGLALIWISWSLYKEVRRHVGKSGAPEDETVSAIVPAASERSALIKALFAITLADVTMSIDNVLAVASIGRHDLNVLVFGIVLAVILMAFFASMVAWLLVRFPWISYFGIALLLYIAYELIHEDWPNVMTLIANNFVT